MEAKTVNKYNEDWLNENRLVLDPGDDLESYIRNGYRVRRVGGKVYAYSPEYKEVSKVLRKSAYERIPTSVLYKHRMHSLDVPMIKPGFTTTLALDDTRRSFVQVYHPVTGPDNQYPAWLLKYMNPKKGKRHPDVVFYDIGIVKLPGEKRARRVAIYKEGNHFETFVPSLNDKLVRTAAIREPVHLSEAAVHVGVATYQKLAERAKERFAGNAKSLPRFNAELDGGYSQIGYISMYDFNADKTTIRSLHAYKDNDRIVPYINITANQVAPDPHHGDRAALKRNRRLLDLSKMRGDDFRGTLVTVVYVTSKDDVGVFRHEPLPTETTLGDFLIGRAMWSFQTSKPNPYNMKKQSPGRTIDYTLPEEQSDLKPLIDITNKHDDERIKKIEEMVTKITGPGSDPLTHSHVVSALLTLKELNDRATQLSKHLNFRGIFPENIKVIEVENPTERLAAAGFVVPDKVLNVYDAAIASLPSSTQAIKEAKQKRREEKEARKRARGKEKEPELNQSDLSENEEEGQAVQSGNESS